MQNRIFAHARRLGGLDDAGARWRRSRDLPASGARRRRPARAPAASSPRRSRRRAGLKILTIHAFCERVLHLFPFEANVPAQFAVLDERGAAELARPGPAGDRRRGECPAGRPARPGHGAHRRGGRRRALSASCSARSPSSARPSRDVLRDAGPAVARSACAGCSGLSRAKASPRSTPRSTRSASPASQWPGFAAVLGRGGRQDGRSRRGLRRRRGRGAGRARGGLPARLHSPRKARRASPRAFRPRLSPAAHPDLAAALIGELARITPPPRAAQAGGGGGTHARRCIAIAEALLSGYEAAKRGARRRSTSTISSTAPLALLLPGRRRLGALQARPRHRPHPGRRGAGHQPEAMGDHRRSLAARVHRRRRARAARCARTIFAVGDEKQSIFSFQGAAPAEFARMRGHFAHGLRGRRCSALQRRVDRSSIPSARRAMCSRPSTHVFADRRQPAGPVLGRCRRRCTRRCAPTIPAGSRSGRWIKPHATAGDRGLGRALRRDAERRARWRARRAASPPAVANARARRRPARPARATRPATSWCWCAAATPCSRPSSAP